MGFYKSFVFTHPIFFFFIDKFRIEKDHFTGNIYKFRKINMKKYDELFFTTFLRKIQHLNFLISTWISQTFSWQLWIWNKFLLLHEFNYQLFCNFPETKFHAYQFKKDSSTFSCRFQKLRLSPRSRALCRKSTRDLSKLCNVEIIPKNRLNPHERENLVKNILRFPNFYANRKKGEKKFLFQETCNLFFSSQKFRNVTFHILISSDKRFFLKICVCDKNGKEAQGDNFSIFFFIFCLPS